MPCQESCLPKQELNNVLGKYAEKLIPTSKTNARMLMLFKVTCQNTYYAVFFLLDLCFTFPFCPEEKVPGTEG